MTDFKGYNFLLLYVVLSIVIILLPNTVFAGCGGLDLTLRKYHYEAQALIDESQDCSIGTYQLIIKTPTGKTFRFSEKRDGQIQQMWIEPLDKRQRPCIILWLQSIGSGSYGKLDVYMPVNNDYIYTEIAAPSPSMKGYQGHEQYRVTDGSLYLSFPRYKPNDPNYRPTGGQALFKYDFQNKKWVEQ